jgi:hypothetical protein
MAGLVPAIPIAGAQCSRYRDRRDKPGDDIEFREQSEPLTPGATQWIEEIETDELRADPGPARGRRFVASAKSLGAPAVGCGCNDASMAMQGARTGTQFLVWCLSQGVQSKTGALVNFLQITTDQAGSARGCGEVGANCRVLPAAPHFACTPYGRRTVPSPAVARMEARSAAIRERRSRISLPLHAGYRLQAPPHSVVSSNVPRNGWAG